MIRLVLWLLWVWLIVNVLDNLPLFSEHRSEAITLAVAAFTAGYGAELWRSRGEVRTLKATISFLRDQLEDYCNLKKEHQERCQQLKEGELQIAQLTQENKRLIASQGKLRWNGYFYITKDGDGPFCKECWTREMRISRLKANNGSFGGMKCPSCGARSYNSWSRETNQIPEDWK